MLMKAALVFNSDDNELMVAYRAEQYIQTFMIVCVVL